MTEKSSSLSPGSKITDTPTPQSSDTLAVAQPPVSTPQPEANATRPIAAPASTTANPAPAATASTSHAKTTYVVKSGDTLSKIAKVHGTTVKALKAANNLDNDRIVVGARLKIPEV